MATTMATTTATSSGGKKKMLLSRGDSDGGLSSSSSSPNSKKATAGRRYLLRDDDDESCSSGSDSSEDEDEYDGVDNCLDVFHYNNRNKQAKKNTRKAAPAKRKASSKSTTPPTSLSSSESSPLRKSASPSKKTNKKQKAQQPPQVVLLDSSDNESQTDNDDDDHGEEEKGSSQDSSVPSSVLTQPSPTARDEASPSPLPANRQRAPGKKKTKKTTPPPLVPQVGGTTEAKRTLMPPPRKDTDVTDSLASSSTGVTAVAMNDPTNKEVKKSTHSRGACSAIVSLEESGDGGLSGDVVSSAETKSSPPPNNTTTTPPNRKRRCVISQLESVDSAMGALDPMTMLATMAATQSKVEETVVEPKTQSVASTLGTTSHQESTVSDPASSLCRLDDTTTPREEDMSAPAAEERAVPVNDQASNEPSPQGLGEKASGTKPAHASSQHVASVATTSNAGRPKRSSSKSDAAVKTTTTTKTGPTQPKATKRRKKGTDEQHKVATQTEPAPLPVPSNAPAPPSGDTEAAKEGMATPQPNPPVVKRKRKRSTAAPLADVTNAKESKPTAGGAAEAMATSSSKPTATAPTETTSSKSVSIKCVKEPAKKKRRTFQDQVLQHMLVSCKPFSLKTLATEMRTTETALNHLMLSLVDKQLVLKKEFGGGGGRSKVLYWANQDNASKDVANALASPEEIRNAEHEHSRLSDEQTNVGNELATVLQDPSNDDLPKLLGNAETRVTQVRSQIKEIQDRITARQVALRQNKSSGDRSPRRFKRRINAMRQVWKDRKEKCMDFVEQLADAMEKKVKTVMGGVVDVTTDEMDGVTMPPKYVDI